MKDKISIIVPIYNSSKYLDRCIKSIINQTYKNIEILLVDDGSTDDSFDKCNKYKNKDKRIKIYTKENEGVSATRNFGISKATGKYFSFVDSDDYIEKNYIEVLYKGLTKYNSKICLGGYRTIYLNGKIENKSSSKEYQSNKKEALTKLLYVDGVDVSPCSKLYDISLFKNIKYPVNRLFEDTATTYKIIDQCDNIAVCDYPIYNYCIRSKSITSEKFDIKKMDWIISALEMTHYIKSRYKDLDKACLAYLMYSHIGVLSSLAMNDNGYKRERKEIVDFIKRNKTKYIKDNKVSKQYKMVTILISTNYFLFKIALNVFQRIKNKRYE